MHLTQIIILSFVQGVTEFLPISSSAHLILLPHLLHYSDQGLAFDVAVHLGTLIAVIAYFFQDIKKIIIAWFKQIIYRQSSIEAKLAWAVILATIPVAVIGLLSKDIISSYLRSPLVIATTTILFGLLLWIAEAKASIIRDEKEINKKDIITIGLAQALALIPGTSRSGITMTAGLFTGLTRQAAARFSFLLAMPVIILASLSEMKDLIEGHVHAAFMDLILGFVIAMLTAFICIHYFLKILNHFGFMPFVIYRIILGCVLLYIFI